MPLVIPTYGRSDRMKTFNNLPPKLRWQTCLVVQENEAVKYQGYPIVAVLPERIRDIASTRDYIVQHLYPDHPIIMFDDDLEFAVRLQDNPGKLVPANEIDIENMVELLYQQLHMYQHVSVSPREGANRSGEMWLDNNRAMRVLGYNTGLLNKLGIKFAPYTFMCDFGVTLELLTRGYDNTVLNWYVNNQAGSNAKGGCSEQRSPNAQAAAASYLREKFPEFVTIVQKHTKSSWGGGVRTDVRVQWKRAYTLGTRRQSPVLDGGTREDPTGEGGFTP